MLDVGGARLAFTTDSYVVRPLFFPGGDIGTLAVNGTVNDLAMCGARPLYLSAGFILEEGLPMETLRRIVAVDADAPRRPPASTLVTGDTKVVDRGKGDGVFINTAGIGVDRARPRHRAASVRPGDAVLLSRRHRPARHGGHGRARRAWSSRRDRERLRAARGRWSLALLDAGIDVHCLRDLTRGGLASALVEIAEAAGLHIRIDEARDSGPRGRPRRVRDPRPRSALRRQRGAVRRLRARGRRRPRARRPAPLTRSAAAPARSATVSRPPAGLVTLRSRIGATRVVDMLSGEQLPRIC